MIQGKHAMLVAVVALLIGVVAAAGILAAAGDALEDDHMWIGSANDIAVPEEIEDCDTTTSHKLQYDQDTNVFSCDSTAPGSSITTQEDNADDQSVSQIDWSTGLDRAFSGGEDVVSVDPSEFGTDWIDAVTDATAGIRSGTDSTFVTGTAGTSGNCVEWDANGDAVDAGAACGVGGGGSAVVLDLDDDAADESTDLAEIATVNDTNAIFTESAADKLLIDLSNNWPTADTADALSANGANCGAGNYPLGVDESGVVESCTVDDDVPESGDFGNAGDLEADGTISANSVALATDTTGAYVATVADAGNSTIAVVGSGAENAAVTIDAVDLNCTDCIGTTEIADSYVLNTGDDITVADAANIDGLTVTQNDTTNDTDGVVITQNANGAALRVTQTADTNGSRSTGGAVNINNSSNTETGLVVYTNQGAGQNGRLVRLEVDDPDFDQEILYIHSDATGSKEAIRIDAEGAPAIVMVETDQVSPAGKFEIQVQSDSFEINGRNAGDSGFEVIVDIERVADGGGVTFTQYDCTGNTNGGVLTADASGLIFCDDDDGGAGGGGDNVTVNSTAADTTANLLDGDIDWTLVDGGAGGPDDITATVACTDCVTLATETTGAYVADLTAGTAIDVTGGGAENANVTVDWDSTEVGTTTYGSGSGFTVTYDAGATDPNVDYDSELIRMENAEVRIGNAGTANNTTGDGDLYVENVLEVDGLAYLSNGLFLPGASVISATGGTPLLIGAASGGISMQAEAVFDISTLDTTGDVSIDNQSDLRLLEADGNGSNYIAIEAPAAVTSNITCTLEDDSTPFDSCVTPGAGAQNLFATINAPAGTDPVADATADTLNLTSTGATLTITGDETTDTVNFEAVDVACTDCLNATEIDDIYLLNSGDAGTGVFDFGSADSFEIPNGTNDTVNAEGEISHDTTDDMLILGADADVIPTQFPVSITIFDPVDADNFVFFAMSNWGGTVTDIECVVDPAGTGESVVIGLYESDASADFTNLTTNGLDGATTITCGNTTAEDDGTLSNGTLDEGDWLGIDVGTVTGTVSVLTVTAWLQVTRE